MKHIPRASILILVTFIGTLLSPDTSSAQTKVRVVRPRNAGSTIAVSPIRKVNPVQSRATVSIRQPTERQLIQQRNDQLLRQRGLPRIPNAQKPEQWGQYYDAMDQAKKEVLGKRYIPPTPKEQLQRSIGTGLGIINSLPRPQNPVRVF